MENKSFRVKMEPADLRTIEKAIKSLTPAEKLDSAFNKMRGQLDWLTEAVKWQNKALMMLLSHAEIDCGYQSEEGNNEGPDGDSSADS